MLGFTSPPRCMTADIQAPPPAVPLPLRTVVTQNRVQGGREARSGRDRQCFRFPYVIASASSELYLSHQGWILGSSAEEAMPNNYAIVEISMEANGVVVPVTYGGVRGKTITTGDVDVHSDAILPSAFGLSEFAYGSMIWVKGIVSVPSVGQQLPYTSVKNSDYTNSQVGWWTSGSHAVSPTDVSGVYTITGGSFDVRTNGYRPMVLGRPVLDVPSFVTIGDSIADLSSDNAAIPIELRIHGLAFIQRSMRSTMNDGYLPSLNLARSATPSTAASGGTRLKQFYKYARFGIDEYGTNNMPSAGSALTPLQSSCTTSWTDMRNAGIEKIIRTKYLPRCTSSDSFMTVANQAYQSAWGPGESSESMNMWFEAELLAGRIDCLISMDGCRSALFPLKWRTAVPETVPLYTAGDATHPSSQGHEFLAEELRSVLRGL